jgi:hypothetical protein
MTDERHGLPSASMIHRLSACPGSLRQCAGIPDRPTADSDFGTHVHDYLAGKLKPEDITPEELDIAESCERIEQKVVTNWMAQCGFVADEAEVTVSRDTTRLWLMVDGVRACSGLADVMRLHQGCALIIDFKTLPGDHKDADENLQLRCLAVLAGARFHNLRRVDVAIIQPLVTHSPKVCSYDAEALSMARKELLSILHEGNSPSAPLKAGDHCKFCRANAVCPETRKEVETLSSLTIHHAGLTVSDEDIANLRNRCGAAKKMIASIEAEAFRRAEADPETWRKFGYEIHEGSEKRTVADVTTVSTRLNEMGASWGDIAGACSITLKSVEALARKATGEKGMALKSKVDGVLFGCIEMKKAKPSLKRIGASEDEDEE